MNYSGFNFNAALRQQAQKREQATPPRLLCQRAFHAASPAKGYQPMEPSPLSSPPDVAPPPVAAFFSSPSQRVQCTRAERARVMVLLLPRLLSGIKRSGHGRCHRPSPRRPCPGRPSWPQWCNGRSPDLAGAHCDLHYITDGKAESTATTSALATVPNSVICSICRNFFASRVYLFLYSSIYLSTSFYNQLQIRYHLLSD